MPRKVRLEEMLPHEIDEAMKERPVAYIPWGSLEWHGPHNPIGLDALKVHELCIRAALQTGGVVLPPIFVGYQTMKPWMGFPKTIEIDSETVTDLLFQHLQQLYDEGFKLIVMMAGHYGQEHVKALRAAEEKFNNLHAHCQAWVFPEYEVVIQDGYRGDHAGRYESSLMMYLRPGLTDLSRLPEGPLTVEKHGLGGQDPRESSEAYGKEIAEAIIRRTVEGVDERLPR